MFVGLFHQSGSSVPVKQKRCYIGLQNSAGVEPVKSGARSRTMTINQNTVTATIPELTKNGHQNQEVADYGGTNCLFALWSK